MSSQSSEKKGRDSSFREFLFLSNICFRAERASSDVEISV